MAFVLARIGKQRSTARVRLLPSFPFRPHFPRPTPRPAHFAPNISPHSWGKFQLQQAARPELECRRGAAVAAAAAGGGGGASHLRNLPLFGMIVPYALAVLERVPE